MLVSIIVCHINIVNFKKHVIKIKKYQPQQDQTPSTCRQISSLGLGTRPRALQSGVQSPFPP